MLVACDIDGTLDSEPRVMQSLLMALRAAGHKVVIVTGCSTTQVTQADIDDKTGYLQSLGCANCYDQLVVVADPADENKAAWLKSNKADLLIDNAIANAKAAKDICPVLVLWQSRIKD